MAALNSELTPELVREGLARELVRRIQELHKQARLEIADRITTYYQARAELAAVFESWAEYIQAETLTSRLVAEAPPEEIQCEDYEIDGLAMRLGVARSL